MNEVYASCVPTVMTYDQASLILGKHSDDEPEQLNTNFAWVYTTAEGVMVLPNTPSVDQSTALLFKDRFCLDLYIQNDYFPALPGNPELAEEYSKHIMLVGSPKLHHKLGIEYPNETKDVESLMLRLKAQFLLSNLEGQYLLTLFLGGLLAENLDGNLVSLKKYGEWNPYLSPGIRLDNGTIIDIFDTFEIIRFWDRQTKFSELLALLKKDPQILSEDDLMHIGLIHSINVIPNDKD